MTGTDGPRSAVDRIRDVLESFSPERPAQTLSEISTRTRIPLTTAHRLLTRLAGWGALERGDDGRYRIGLRLWEIASLAPRGPELRASAMPFLGDLYELTHQNVQLAVLDGTEAVYLERISGRNAITVISRSGGRLPLHATGVGLVLLAHAPRELQEQVLDAPLRRYTPRTIATSAELRRVIAAVRRDGYVVSDGQIELPALSVAAPVRGPGDVVVAAVSVAVPSEGTDASALVLAVRAAARGISRALGSSQAGRLSSSARRETHGLRTDSGR